MAGICALSKVPAYAKMAKATTKVFIFRSENKKKKIAIFKIRKIEYCKFIYLLDTCVNFKIHSTRLLRHIETIILKQSTVLRFFVVIALSQIRSVVMRFVKKKLTHLSSVTLKGFE